MPGGFAAEALAAVDRYLVALNARDTAAIRAAFNFPHLRIGASGSLARYFSLYVVTSQDGHWGIQVGSGDGS